MTTFVDDGTATTAVITDVDVCNMALSNLGNTIPVSSLTEDSVPANLCAIWWTRCLDSFLEEFPWPFAKKTMALTDLGTPPNGWGYRYAYPPDCLSARRVLPGGGDIAENADSRVRFKIAQDGPLRVILCDEASVVLEYTRRETRLSLFPPSALEALSWALSARLAPGLTGDTQKGTAAAQTYQYYLLQAMAKASTEGHQAEPESSFVCGRF